MAQVHTHTILSLLLGCSFIWMSLSDWKSTFLQTPTACPTAARADPCLLCGDRSWFSVNSPHTPHGLPCQDGYAVALFGQPSVSSGFGLHYWVLQLYTHCPWLPVCSSSLFFILSESYRQWTYLTPIYLTIVKTVHPLYCLFSFLGNFCKIISQSYYWDLIHQILICKGSFWLFESLSFSYKLPFLF